MAVKSTEGLGISTAVVRLFQRFLCELSPQLVAVDGEQEGENCYRHPLIMGEGCSSLKAVREGIIKLGGGVAPLYICGGRRGSFVVFEGGDRCGKTTQVEKFVSYLGEVGPVVQLHFPIRTTESGKTLDRYLRKEISLSPLQSHLLFALNRWEACDWILKTLEDGTSIVCDRYSFSGMAYSVGALGMDPEDVAFLEVGLPKPDVVFQICVDVGEAQQREGFGDEIYEKEKQQIAVDRVFTHYRSHDYWHVVNGMQSIDKVHEDIVKLYETLHDCNLGHIDGQCLAEVNVT